MPVDAPYKRKQTQQQQSTLGRLAAMRGYPPGQGFLAAPGGDLLLPKLLSSQQSWRCLCRVQVVGARSYNVVPVVEGLHDMGNLAAVCRSADGERRGCCLSLGVHKVRGCATMFVTWQCWLA